MPAGLSFVHRSSATSAAGRQTSCLGLARSIARIALGLRCRLQRKLGGQALFFFLDALLLPFDLFGFGLDTGCLGFRRETRAFLGLACQSVPASGAPSRPRALPRLEDGLSLGLFGRHRRIVRSRF